jgi:hypothetical protein
MSEINKRADLTDEQLNVIRQRVRAAVADVEEGRFVEVEGRKGLKKLAERVKARRFSRPADNAVVLTVHYSLTALFYSTVVCILLNYSRGQEEMALGRLAAHHFCGNGRRHTESMISSKNRASSGLTLW